jgi:hypothetical protein
LFDPFSYCVNARGEQISNLPVAVLQRMVIAMGGTIDASATATGREFKLSLPVFRHR